MKLIIKTVNNRLGRISPALDKESELSLSSSRKTLERVEVFPFSVITERERMIAKAEGFILGYSTIEANITKEQFSKLSVENPILENIKASLDTRIEERPLKYAVDLYLHNKEISDKNGITIDYLMEKVLPSISNYTGEVESVRLLHSIFLRELNIGKINLLHASPALHLAVDKLMEFEKMGGKLYAGGDFINIDKLIKAIINNGKLTDEERLYLSQLLGEPRILGGTGRELWENSDPSLVKEVLINPNSPRFYSELYIRGTIKEDLKYFLNNFYLEMIPEEHLREGQTGVYHVGDLGIITNPLENWLDADLTLIEEVHNFFYLKCGSEVAMKVLKFLIDTYIE